MAIYLLPRIVRPIGRPALPTFLILAAALSLVTGCKPAQEAPKAQIRPVRTVTVDKREGGEAVTLTGQVQAQDEVNLSFRVGGRMIERSVNVGAKVTPGQVIGRLEADPAENALRSARANVAAARAALVQAANHFDRQNQLLRDGWTTRAMWDQAVKAEQTAQAQVDSAEAQYNTARDNLSYTQLIADSAGTVIAVGAEPGEVVGAGRMIVQLARQGGRDAVFDVPARVKEAAPADPVITVVLAADPTVMATGRVREISPQADPITRTFQIKVGLSDVPNSMRLGSTVTGTVRLGRTLAIDIPATALTSANSQPAVWVVDPATSTVALRNIEIGRFDIASVQVASGLEPNDIVVTAGVQALRPGQKVSLLRATP